MAGHLAIKRTMQKVLSEFYWPGINSDIKRFCQSCDICQRTIPKGKIVKAPLGKMPRIDVPFRRVATDLIGPLKPVTYNKTGKYSHSWIMLQYILKLYLQLPSILRQ